MRTKLELTPSLDSPSVPALAGACVDRARFYSSPKVLMTALAAVMLVGHWGCSQHLPAAHRPSRPTRSISDAPVFRDIAAAAGIRYRWRIDGSRPINILQGIGNGCAFLDYNNDGNLDILLVGSKLALYRGDGHGHFIDVSKETGLAGLSGHFLGCAVGDYDNDGYDDIYLSAYQGGALLHNEHGQSFRDVTAGSGIRPQPWGTSCAWADFDNDGKLDLYIGNYVDFTSVTQPQLCNYAGIKSACGPTYYRPLQGVVYRNLGAGHFRDVTRSWGANDVSGRCLGVACADFDSSGYQSIALANDETPGDLLHNGPHHFENTSITSGTAYDARGQVHAGMGVDWGDYDNDGRPDLAVGTFAREPDCVYHNMGRGVFSERSGPLGLAQATDRNVTFGLKWIDYDNDGWLDLIVANGHIQDNVSSIDKTAAYREPSQLFHNVRGTGLDDVTLSAGPAFQKPLVGRGLAVGDFDNDGRIDVLIVDSDGAPLLLHNEAKDAGHWLSVRLIGRRCNRDALGSVLTLRAGGLTQTRLCTTGGSYLSSSDRRVHVGLGAASIVSRLIIHWADGRSQILSNLRADRQLTVTEGQAAIPIIPVERSPAPQF